MKQASKEVLGNRAFLRAEIVRRDQSELNQGNWQKCLIGILWRLAPEKTRHAYVGHTSDHWRGQSARILFAMEHLGINQEHATDMAYGFSAKSIDSITKAQMLAYLDGLDKGLTWPDLGA